MSSSSVGSAQWMSSMTTTIGPAAPARISSSRRTAQKSLGDRERTGDEAQRPTRGGRDLVDRCEQLPDLALAASAGRPRRSPPRRRTTSTTGQNVMPSPYGRHRPRRTVASSADRAEELPDEPRLADAGVADDGHHAAAGRRSLGRARPRGRPSRSRGRPSGSARRGDAVAPACRPRAIRRRPARPCP